jgi:putative DNA primase/helicase
MDGTIHLASRGRYGEQVMSTFIDFARSHGLDIDPSKFYASDKIRRCGTLERPRSLNGSWLWDGQRGWVFDWSGEARTIWFEDPHAKPWTPQEKQDWMLKRQTAAAAKDRSYDMAAQKADIILRSAKSDVHPYLTIKGFPDMKGLVLDDKLLIPMRNVVTNKLQGYQEIWWDEPNRKYNKKMLAGMRAKNAVFFLGDRTATEAWCCEGYATGLSLHAALRSVGLKASVVVCFSASNLVAVADQIQGKRYIYADNDASETGAKSAIQTGLPWTMSDTIGHDANDDHLKSGLFLVVKKIMDLRTKSLI